MTLDEYFEGRPDARAIFEAVRQAADAIGPVEYRVTKSQIALARGATFAIVWIPGVYLHGRGAPLVLTLPLRHRDPSPRWKEVVEPHPGRFTHHLELWSPDDIDSEVIGWLREAWDEAE